MFCLWQINVHRHFLECSIVLGFHLGPKNLDCSTMCTQVLTVRGRTGCVLVMHPISGEEAGVIADSFLTRSICAWPLNMALSESAPVRPQPCASSWISSTWLIQMPQRGTPPTRHRGVNTPEFDQVTESRRGQILTGGMSKAVADKIMKELQGGKPWPSERSFVESLAAFVKTFPEAVDKTIPGPNRTGRQILHTACAPGRLQWYWNNLRARHQLSVQRLQMLPAGTASNEALHAEVRAWFRETQQMHQSTLRLKLRVLHLAKLIPHSAAMYRPTLRQISSGVVLARCALSSPWHGQIAWQAFAGHFGKALLPLQEKRKREVAAVGKQSFKKPARKRPAAKLETRTPFTRKRVSKLRIMGKKRWLEALYLWWKKCLCRCQCLPCEIYPCLSVDKKISQLLEVAPWQLSDEICMWGVWLRG